MAELWTELGVAEPARLRGLNVEDVTALFRTARHVRFWVTTVFGDVVAVIPPERCFHFWKREAKEHLIRDGIYFNDEWRGSYAFMASEWRSPLPEPIVVLSICD